MRRRLMVLVLAGAAAGGAPAAAQSANATLSAPLASLARLSLSTNTLTFPDADPDLVPQVPALQGPVTITAKARAPQGGVVTLTVRASDDLRSGITVLPATLVTWTASGAGFVSGTVSSSSAQLVATWTGPGVHTGTQSYAFENRWTHPTGTYTLTLVYTISVP
jgi:hypothetical protein